MSLDADLARAGAVGITRLLPAARGRGAGGGELGRLGVSG